MWYIILGTVGVIGIVILSYDKYRSRPLTNEEWDEILNESWKNKNKE